MAEAPDDHYKRLLDNRIALVQGPINKTVAQAVVAMLLFFQKEDPRLEVNMIIDSPGGELNPSLAIVDTMKYVRTPIRTHCAGQAAGMALVLLAHGLLGKRSASFKCHLQMVEFAVDCSFSATSVRISDTLLRAELDVAALLESRTRRQSEHWRAKMQANATISPEEALDWGIIDELVQS